MLRKMNDDDLIHRGKVDPKYVFFIQRWRELLDARTLDMYQYKILNSYVACQELQDVIEKTQNGLFVSRQNIDDCKEETLTIVKNDEILKNKNISLWRTLVRTLAEKVDGKSRSQAMGDKDNAFYIALNKLKYRLMGPMKTLSEMYLDYILDELYAEINNGNKKALEYATQTLISLCVYKGWSTKGLARVVECFEGEDRNTAEKWTDFTNLLKQEKSEFSIYYSIKIVTKPGATADVVRNAVRDLGLNVRLGADIIAESTGQANLGEKIKSGTTYIIKEIDATDSYAAVLSAINFLNSKISIASFYNIIDPLTASDPTIIVYGTSMDVAQSVKLTDIFKTNDYVDSNNNIFRDTIALAQDGSKKEVETKLNSAFAYTNLSRASSFQETKYISLWIALESVMRTGQHSDIISHIKLVLPEILCVRYIYRMIRNFSEDCMRCDICSFGDINMKEADKKALAQKLILAFRSEEQYLQLLDKCDRNQLLKYRCGEIHVLLNDKMLICKKFDAHIQNIRFHVQRLYRIRNEITHSAFKDDKSLVIYIEHLYTYLAQLISEVVYYVEHKNVESVDEALSTIYEKYYTYYELIESEEWSIENVLPNGVIDF